MKKGIGKALLFFLGMISLLQAEVEEIVISWNAFKCLNTCIPLIEQNFGAIKNVTNLQVNAPSGTAVMGWDPNYPFSYEPFRLASSAVGFHIDSMRIRVRGTISHDVDNFYLISNGDNARFLLIGPLNPEPGRYIPIYNLATHPLTPNMKETLLAAEDRMATIVISGPLFLPSHYPRTLIAEQIQLDLTKNQMDLRYQR